MIQTQALPVIAQADVVVCGGGTAGVFAAVAAAEQGAKVLLLEQAGCVGGLAVGGLVTPMMSLRLPKDVTCSYLNKRMGEKRYTDPTVLGFELEQLCLRAGVELLYQMTVVHAHREGDRVTEVVCACKKGLVRVQGRVFIDATGDGDLAAFAGAAFQAGDPETGANQPMSLRYLVGGVDLAALGAFLERMGREIGPAHTASAGREYHQVYAAVMSSGQWALKALFEEGIRKGELLEEDLTYWQLIGIPGRRDAVALNNPEFLDLTDALDPRQLTQLQTRGRKAIFRQLEFYRRHFPGCENAYVSQIAPMPGIRESRRIRTVYHLSWQDLATRKKFPDRIAQSNYPVDIHGLPLDQQAQALNSPEPWFEVPYRSLVVEGVANLLVAGRCLGADFIAQSTLRIQPTCRSMGEAAGIAAAMALAEGTEVSRLDGAAVARKMEALGAEFI